MAIVVDNYNNSFGSENLQEYRPYPYHVINPLIGEIRPDASIRREDVSEHSFIGYDEIADFNPVVNDPNDLPVDQNDEIELRRARRSNLVDTLFGLFGKASDVYTELKYGREERPYELEISARQEDGLSTNQYFWIGAGLLIAGLLIASQVKK